MKSIAAALLSICFFTPALLNAQTNQPVKTLFPVMNWTSKNSSDSITIQNGAGTPIMIIITVSSQGAHAGGAVVNNCGSTTYIKAGSSSVCETNDIENPVTLTSDGVSLPVSGTYQIKEEQ